MVIPGSSFLLRRELDIKKHNELAEAKVLYGFYTSERGVQKTPRVDLSLPN